MGNPRRFISLLRASSPNGLRLSSPSIISRSIVFSFLVDSSSPLSVFMLSLKKCLSLNVPHLVCAYLRLLTLDTVLMSSHVRSATSFSIIGLRSPSSPSLKYFLCMSMVARMVTYNVLRRCFIASMKPCALSIFSFA